MNKQASESTMCFSKNCSSVLLMIRERVAPPSPTWKWVNPGKATSNIDIKPIAAPRVIGVNSFLIERAGGFEPHPVKVLSRTAQSIAVDGVFTGEEKIVVEGVVALKAAWQGEK